MLPTLNIKQKSRLLIVSPHPDDETIGCGGILALYGPQCDVLLLTDGRRGKLEGSDYTEEKTAAVRQAEFEAVMDFFHVCSHLELHVPDGTLGNHANAVAVDLRQYDYIFVPNRNERHPDHKAAYEILKKLYKAQNTKGTLVEYEVWSPLIAANRFLDVSAVMDRKLAGLAKYVSQIASIDYEALAKGLNMYRGAPHHVAFCEAYYTAVAGQYGIKQAVARKLPKGLRKGLAGMKKRFTGKRSLNEI